MGWSCEQEKGIRKAKNEENNKEKEKKKYEEYCGKAVYKRSNVIY